MKSDNQILHILALSRVPKVGPVLAKNLIAYCGGAERVFKTPKSKILKIPQVGPAIAANLKDPAYLFEAEREMKFCRRKGIQILHFRDPGYPQRLIHFEDAPVVLYFAGNADLNRERIVSIIGTRSPTGYGREQCEQIIMGLQKYEVMILSGLAFGIDSVAHRTALAQDMATVAVLGHGLDRIYPFQNAPLAKKMLPDGGLLTEFPSGTKPDRENFPMRNRIIAALSDALVVIESGSSGGSMITAEFGNEYSKDVFALPGQVVDEKSKGTNGLIKRHKAHLIETANDIGYIMQWDPGDVPKRKQNLLFHDLGDNEKLIFQYLRDNGEARIDLLHTELKLPHSRLARELLELELKGVIKSLPGKKYTILK